MTALALFTLTLVGAAQAQLSYLEQPEVAWTQSFAPLTEGNAVAVSPDGSTVYVTSADGQLALMNSVSGELIKSYLPPQNGDLVPGSNSGVEFGESAALGAFAVYAVTDGINTASEFW
jgi:WD40 repeat protein